MGKFIYILLILFCVNLKSEAQWFQVYGHSTAQSCFAVKFYDSNTGYHSGVLYNSSFFNIYKTTNGGINWTSQNSNYTAQRFMAIHIIHPDTVFICGNYGRIIRTYDGGANWVQVYSDTLMQFWGMKFVNSFTGFVTGSYGSFLKTTNRGNNWTALPTGVTSAMQGMHFINELTGYISGSLVILKTTDAGASWSNLNAPYVSFETNTDVYFADESTGWFSTNSGRIVKTSDGGVNWNIVYEQPGTAVWRLSFTDSQTGYGCTSDGKVLKTTNGGSNWFVQNTPLTENLYYIHFPVPDTGYAASWSGKILKTTNGGGNPLSVSNYPDENPLNYHLSQNYPNPFNPSTKIKFSVPESGIVTMKIYDIAGKEVMTLVNEMKQPGSYEVMFSAINLTSGVYFCRMNSGDYSGIISMLLLK